MHPGTDPASALILVFAMFTLGYIVSCWIWPFKPCRRCDGRGHGLRLRIGRKAWNTYRRLHHAHTRDRHNDRHNRDR